MRTRCSCSGLHRITVVRTSRLDCSSATNAFHNRTEPLSVWIAALRLLLRFSARDLAVESAQPTRLVAESRLATPLQTRPMCPKVLISRGPGCYHRSCSVYPARTLGCGERGKRWLPQQRRRVRQTSVEKSAACRATSELVKTSFKSALFASQDKIPHVFLHMC